MKMKVFKTTRRGVVRWLVTGAKCMVSKVAGQRSDDVEWALVAAYSNIFALC
jgi:hypothetical protein